MIPADSGIIASKWPQKITTPYLQKKNCREVGHILLKNCSPTIMPAQ
jgi:hypothetical protein